MSVEAITWALKEAVTPSSMKFVLVVLANCANTDTCEAYPSAAYLADATGQDRKTIQTNIKRLIELGYIIDTGDRRGRTGQVIVYRLNCPWCKPPEQTQKRAPLKRPEIPVKEARFSPQRGPKTGYGTQRKLKEPNTPQPPDGGERGFDAIATGYPKKVDMGKARKCWETIAPSANLERDIESAISAWAKSEEWGRDNGRWIPKFSNWLRHERWKDLPGVDAPVPKPAAPPLPAQVASPMSAEVRAKIQQILGRKSATKTAQITVESEVM